MVVYKTTAKELPNLMAKITKQIAKQVPLAVANGAKDSYQEEILRNIPVVTGKTITAFDPVVTNVGNVKNVLIGRFASEAPEFLERGRNSDFWSYSEKGNLMFLPDWVALKNLDNRFKSGWVRVGGNNTYFGRPENQWFTNSTKGVKESLYKYVKPYFSLVEQNNL